MTITIRAPRTKLKGKLSSVCVPMFEVVMAELSSDPCQNVSMDTVSVVGGGPMACNRV